MGYRNSALYTLKGPEAEKQLGMPEGGEIIHMRLMRIGDSAMLELFQVDKVEQGASQTIADYGLTHIGVCVDDIDAAAEQFREAGGRLLAPIRGLTGVEGGKGNEGVYGRAPGECSWNC
jgi:hypothetical protein